MSDLQIIPVKTRSEKKRFLNLPWQIYKNDQYWIPPLRLEQKELVNYKHHPFYDRNEVQTFIAVRGKETVGRVAAIVNHDHIERYNDRIGFWGFFESIDDQEVATGLFEAARDWFAREHDIHAMRGPCNPSLNYTLGLLINGFDSSPFFMMTYNPAYYEQLVEGYGFKKIQDLYAYWGDIDMLPAVQEKLTPLTERVIKHTGVTIRSLDTSRFKEELKSFLHVYNQSMTNTWGFVPMTEGELNKTAAGLKFLIDPDLALAAEIDGRIVGAAFGLLDYNPRIKKIDGRLFPFGWLRLIWNKKKITKLRVISTNVLPEYQLMGVGLVLIAGLVPRAVKTSVSEAEFSWVLESNAFSRGSLEKGGAILNKTYRLYDRRFDKE